MPIKGTGSDQKARGSPLKAIEEEPAEPMLALPPSEGAAATAKKPLVSFPQQHQTITTTTQAGGESIKVDANTNANARDYNELMDQYSLHQIIIRKGQILDTTPEFISFKRSYLNRWGAVSYILHCI